MAADASSVEQIKSAIDNRSLAAVQEWINANAGEVNSPIIKSDDREDPETPLQYAGRLGRIKIAKSLIMGGATVDANLNEYTQLFTGNAQLDEKLKKILSACKTKITGRVSSGKALSEVKATVLEMEKTIGQYISNAKELKKSKIEALWKEIKSFNEALSAENKSDKSDKSDKIRVQFLSNIAVLSSSPLSKAVNRLRVLARKYNNAELIKFIKEVEQKVLPGNVALVLQNAVYTLAMDFESKSQASGVDSLVEDLKAALQRPPLPPRLLGAVHTGQPPEQKQSLSSYGANPKRFSKDRTDFLKPIPYEPNQLSVGKLGQNLLNNIEKPNDPCSRPEKLPGEAAEHLNLGVLPNQVNNGSIGQADALGENAENKFSSFYYAAQKIYKHLTEPGEGYKYFSFPEMELFSEIQALLKDKDYLKSVKIDGKTIWETLNPEGVDVFKVSQLIELKGGEVKSPLEKAMDQHAVYQQEFKTSLSQAGGTYKPTGKNYFFEKKDGRYHLMVKGGKTLSEQEKENAIRELLIITRDMESKLDVNVQMHSAVSAAEAKDLAAIITILGATLDEAKNVAEKDRVVHKAVEDHAIKMQKTAAAPEFSTKDKQKELWRKVADTGMSTVVKSSHISHEIKENDYRLMSADGGRTMPERKKIIEIESDELTYWTKKTELLGRKEWNYIDAGDIVRNVLRSVKEVNPLEANSGTGAAVTEVELSDGVVAHLMPFKKDVRLEIQKDNQKRRDKWTTTLNNPSSGAGSSALERSHSPSPITAPPLPPRDTHTTIETLGDGNCLLHTIVLVLKEKFTELEKAEGYTKFEARYKEKFPQDSSLEIFLKTKNHEELERKLSPLLRPLAVNWLREDKALKDEIVNKITQAWFVQGIVTVPDQAAAEAPSKTREDLKDYVDLFSSDMALSDEQVAEINGAKTENKLKELVETKVFNAMCDSYLKKESNLPPKVAVAAWKKLAKNVELTLNVPELELIKGPAGKKNVKIDLLYSTQKDGEGNISGHYDVKILKVEKSVQRVTCALRSPFFGIKGSEDKPEDKPEDKGSTVTLSSGGGVKPN